jgi:archaeal chaperonin
MYWFFLYIAGLKDSFVLYVKRTDFLISEDDLSDTRTNNNTEVNEKLSALITNASAIRAITGSVEGTIGPKGLDTMLVDRTGDIIITNDGVTILDRMDVAHPAARMLINIARTQHEEIGDGTTTATIMAGTLVSEGLNHIIRGVPVTRVIEGIRMGINCALDEFRRRSISVSFPDDSHIYNVSLIAGRGHEDIARKVADSVKLVGRDKLIDQAYKFKDCVTGLEGAENEVFEGIIVKKRPVNEAMPDEIQTPVFLCLDDSLDIEKIEDASLRTESGFQLLLKRQEEFDANVRKIIDLGINVILLHRGLSERAEQMLTDAGVLVISRLTSGQLRRACEHIGATAVKKNALLSPSEQIKKYTGSAKRIIRDRKLNNYRIMGGSGNSVATLIIGSPTQEVVEEKERIACDAASAVQAAVKGGIVPGGGAIELAVSRHLTDERAKIKGMSAFGVDCVIEALRRPVAQIILNAGFNPLEKMEDLLTAQAEADSDKLGIDCDTGEIVDMLEARIVDPTLVKLHALKAAGEVAEAILRINTIIKMRDIQGNFEQIS